MEPHLRYVTLKQFGELYPWPTPTALRIYRKNRNTNGFDKAFVNVGRRVLVDLKEFWAVIEGLKEK